ncbi:MAG: succinate dehydrogenase cytochrome b subunit [Nitrospiria bacterium]
MINISIIKKQITGFAGLLLCVFAISHLAGNLLMLVSLEVFNRYAHALISNPFIYGIELALFFIFLIHMILAMRLQMENRNARPEKYAMRKKTGRGATFASSTMLLSGLTLLVYLIFHIWHLKFGPEYRVSYDGVGMRDLSRLVLEYFANPLMVGFYVIAMAAFGMHLSHGFWSVFQSFGFSHAKYTLRLRHASIVFGVLMFIGFSILPIWAYLKGVQS